MDTLVRALQRQIIPRVDFAVIVSNHCCPKRLKPKEQNELVRL
jgi:hypothetical protein